jgi:hypothetical protein
VCIIFFAVQQAAINPGAGMDAHPSPGDVKPVMGAPAAMDTKMEPVSTTPVATDKKRPAKTVKRKKTKGDVADDEDTTKKRDRKRLKTNGGEGTGAGTGAGAGVGAGGDGVGAGSGVGEGAIVPHRNVITIPGSTLRVNGGPPGPYPGMAGNPVEARPNPGALVPPADKFRNNDSLCSRMSQQHITDHIHSLVTGFNAIHPPNTIRDRLRNLMTTLFNLEYIESFTTPVDPVKLKIPDYNDVIKRRMDLGTVKKNLGEWPCRAWLRHRACVRTTG